MLVSPLIPKVIAVDGVIVGAFGGILFDFLYYNYGSKCIIEPCRKYYGGLVIGRQVYR